MQHGRVRASPDRTGATQALTCKLLMGGVDCPHLRSVPAAMPNLSWSAAADRRRFGMTAMRRGMTGGKPNRTGIWRHNRHRITRSISASIGEMLRRPRRPPNKLIAKMASTFDKPNGISIVYEADVQTKI
jgi:hypothetical protein